MTEESTATKESETIGSYTSADEEQTQIFLQQDGTTVTGKGASVSGNIVTINQGGAYLISGTLEDGQIYVDASGDEDVYLLFSGIDISHVSDAAVYVENAENTIIVLKDGTNNRLQSGSSAELSAIEDSEDGNSKGAALYARDNLSITGTGALEVFGYINNGIHTTNNLSIESGTISVEARNNGLKGKDSVSISDGVFSIVSGGDGIKADDTTGEGYGTIAITGGAFSIESRSDAIQAETTLEISDGTFSIVSGGGSENAVFSSENGWGSPDSGWDMSDESKTSTKGFKCGTKMWITGGDFSVNSCDDAFHSNGNIQIAGGTFNIATGDDGIHAGAELTIASGDEITVIDSQGNVLISHVSAKEGNSVVFSCPELTYGETYILNAGSQSVEIALDS